MHMLHLLHNFWQRFSRVGVDDDRGSVI